MAESSQSRTQLPDYVKRLIDPYYIIYYDEQKKSDSEALLARSGVQTIQLKTKVSVKDGVIELYKTPKNGVSRLVGGDLFNDQKFHNVMKDLYEHFRSASASDALNTVAASAASAASAQLADLDALRDGVSAINEDDYELENDLDYGLDAYGADGDGYDDGYDDDDDYEDLDEEDNDNNDYNEHDYAQNYEDYYGQDGDPFEGLPQRAKRPQWKTVRALGGRANEHAGDNLDDLLYRQMMRDINNDIARDIAREMDTLMDRELDFSDGYGANSDDSARRKRVSKPKRTAKERGDAKQQPQSSYQNGDASGGATAGKKSGVDGKGKAQQSDAKVVEQQDEDKEEEWITEDEEDDDD